jgi:hypothetical protein
MYQSVHFYDFCRAFETANRNESFSYAGKRVLFDYLESDEDDCAMPIELDVIDLCCVYTECTLNEYNENYSQEFETIEEAAEYIAEQSIVCGYDDTIIVFLSY